MMTGVSLCITPAKAQFNTVAVTPTRYKMEVLDMGLDQAEPASEIEISVQEVSTGIPVSADMDKKKWMDRYLSVSYPLRYIKVTSPYGYRKDPFTGKSKFHGGLDLRARGDKVMAMMEGVVVKVGQDKTSGKYVTLRHGRYTVSYCHLSKILIVKGAIVHPRDVVGITGFHRTQHRRTPAYHLQTQWQEYQPLAYIRLYPIHPAGVYISIGRFVKEK